MFATLPIWALVPLLILALFGAAQLVRLARDELRSRAAEDDDGTSSRLHDLATALEPLAERLASPQDLATNEKFGKGVDILADTAQATSSDLEQYVVGDNWIIASMALEAATRRGERDIVLSALPSLNLLAWSSWFLYRALDQIVPIDEAVLGRLVSRIDSDWEWSKHPRRFFSEFAGRRLAAGDPLTCEDGFSVPVEDQGDVVSILQQLDAPVAERLLEAFSSWRSSQFDLTYLSGVGAVDRWPDGKALVHSTFLQNLERIEHALTQRRAVLLVGDSGVGKTSLVHELLRRWKSAERHVFEAGGPELIADQSFVGQFEGRLQKLVAQLRNAPVLWYVPDLVGLLSAGPSSARDADALDHLLPALERQEVFLISECQPAGWERIAEKKPKLRRVFERVVVEPVDSATSDALARDWLQAFEPPLAMDDETLTEASRLARQFLSDRAAPGNVLQLLEATALRLTATRSDGDSEDDPMSLDTDDLIRSLEHLTGLPSSVLDDRQGLDLAALQDQFEHRILGQRAAVRCLVERIAMIKAGVCDETKPLGVFLFAGPTGTGKTELVKQLARYLFGSDDRMIRLDMSEFQTGESIPRLLGEPGDHSTRGGALVDRVRAQPFSVVLLDEFEKASPAIWDLFLQLFDDGRLTDQRGRVTDFRNTIVVMTSNLGSAIPSSPGIGFDGRAGTFAPTRVHQQIEQHFRPEFLNRIDEIVVFRPFSRHVMRRLVGQEVRRAFQRRGLRRRDWALEWDDSATDFLLDQGFSPTLGARPLKRAVDRHLMAPLARQIVDGKIPEGEQFLFIRSGRGELVVEFVDPDGHRSSAEPVGGTDEPSSLSVRQLALSARGDLAERRFLLQRIEALRLQLSQEALEDLKQRSYSAVAAAGFWSAADRFTTLHRIDALDRIASAQRTVENLADRLQRIHDASGVDEGTNAKGLITRLAHKAWLLSTAVTDLLNGVPWDAFLVLDAPAQQSTQATSFWDQLEEQYRAWADRRGMQMEVLPPLPDEPTGASQHARAFTISGFAAWSLLRPENGLHVLESGPKDQRRRISVRVRVSPQPERPETDKRLLRRRALEATRESANQVSIVRKVRQEPSPWVRDTARGFKTGRLELVFGGNFDLLGDEVPHTKS